jgi:hypothetical protein
MVDFPRADALSGERTGLHSGEYNTVKMHFMTYASRRFVLEGHFFMTNEAVSFAARE